ncbi:MAG: glycosyltransferase family 39 protein [Spirochaetales bacterium]|nr:glycosyltransferase family 39 protein [Spirochaetales bacterium]
MKLPPAAALWLFPLFFAAAIPVAEAQPAATSEVNLLRNPGLESAAPGSPQNSAPRDWEIFQSDRRQGSTVFSFSDEDVYEGRRALLIDIKDPQAAGIFQTVDVRPDTYYRLSVRVKTESLESAGAGVHLAVPGLNAAASGFSGTSNGWGKLQVFFKTAADQRKVAAAVLVGAQDQHVRGRVWLDDASLRRIAGPPPAASGNPTVPEDPSEAAYPWPGPGLAIFIVLACLLFALFVYRTLNKKPVLKGRRMDFVLAGGLTLIYAFIAFYHLGTFDSPQTYYSAQKEGESFTLDLGAPVPVSRIMYFMALGKGSYRLDFSDDLEYWRNPKSLKQGLNDDLLQIFWRMENTGFKTRYLRVTAVRPGAQLGEIAVFSDEDGSLLPIRAVLPGTAAARPVEDPRRVCDEPGRVPLLPSYLNGTYFDECYFARSAYDYTLGLDSYEESHPPLGKLTIALGVELFGFTPFGWRFMGACFGVLMIPVIYAFGVALFKKREWAFVGAFLLAFDFMHFSQTRIATIDVFGVFWIILMYWFMYRALREDPFSPRPGKLFLNLFLSGLCFGLGAASKWIALYGGMGLALALIARYAFAGIRYFRGFFRTLPKDDPAAGTGAGATGGASSPSPNRLLWNHTRPFLQRTGLVCVFSVSVFLVLPAAIYLASYIPFMAVRGPANPGTGPLQLVIDEQKLMYGFHAAQNKPHEFASPWYEWPVVYRPMWFYSGNQYLFHDTTSDIFSFGNPAIWWAGIAAVGALIFLISTPCVILLFWGARNLKKKRRGVAECAAGASVQAGARLNFLERLPAGLFILTALAAQYLPWAVIPRKQTFIYHFFASVPFLILAVVFVLKTLAEKKPGLRWGMFAYLGIAMLLFFLFYPMISGARVDAAFVKDVLKWFPSWFPFL